MTLAHHILYKRPWIDLDLFNSNVKYCYIGLVETLDFLYSFVACDLRIGRNGLFTVLIIVLVFEVKFTFYLDQHDLSQRSFIKDQISGELHQVHWSFLKKKKKRKNHARVFIIHVFFPFRSKSTKYRLVYRRHTRQNTCLSKISLSAFRVTC